MKTLKMIGAVLALVLFAGVLTWVTTGTPPSVEAKATDHKVAICHFGGHDGDYVTIDEGCNCLSDGGNVLVISRNACEKGHNADGDEEACAVVGNVDLLDLDSCNM